MEANIFAKINAVVNVTVTKVVLGSISVTNTVAFTSDNTADALAGQSALVATLSSGDTTIFGTTFGSVAVSNVTQGSTSNPSKSHWCCNTLQDSIQTELIPYQEHLRL